MADRLRHPRVQSGAAVYLMISIGALSGPLASADATPLEPKMGAFFMTEFGKLPSRVLTPDVAFPRRVGRT
jgi:hypothetical protein